MAQYYKAICIINNELQSVEDRLGKLMEHSYIGNSSVETIEFLLLPGGRWDQQPLVWAGDYADEETDEELIKNAHPTSWYRTDGGEATLYSLAPDKGLEMLIDVAPTDHHYLVNFDKQLYVDKTKIPSGDTWGDGSPVMLHPLPLLTVEGNGHGEGDFRGEDPNQLVGSWARNRLGLRKEIPEGFTELIFDLIE